MRQAEDIIEYYFDGQIPFDENITIFYPSVLEAIKQAQKEAFNEAIDKVMPFVPECFTDQVLSKKLK